MATQGIPSSNAIHTITDLQGEVVVEVRQNEYVVIDSDGSVTSYTHNRSIQLVDGSAWDPSMLRARPAIFVGVCEICRNRDLSLFRRRRKTHGLVAMSRARICATCGALCCPGHRRLCSDNLWRCRRCSRRHGIKNILRPLFFERIED